MGTKVLVIGDAILDSYKICSTDRISPEAPVPILLVNNQFERLGGAANVAAGVAAMDVHCTLLTLAGQDQASERLGALLKEAGVGDSTIRLPGRPTISKERIISLGQQICRVDHEEQFSPESSQLLIERGCTMLDAYDLCVFSDYDKGAVAHLPMLIEAARRINKPVLIDPKRTDYKLYRGAFLIKPNWKEFLATVSYENGQNVDPSIQPENHEAISNIAHALMEKYDIAHMVITLGAKGYIHVDREKKLSIHPTKAREVFDLSGAGDSFIATLAAFLAQKTPLERSIELGNIAAGLAVGFFGTSIINLDDLNGFLEKRDDHRSKIEKIKSLARRGKRIVFTNGCFDLLHVGHLAILTQARKEGDVLVVGINSDESIRQLKGPSRPITPLADRIAMLENLRPVDFVIPFSDNTPMQLIEKIEPNVLVKGGDYTEETIVGAQFIKAYGGRVVIVPLQEGRSSTKIIERMHAA